MSQAIYSVKGSQRKVLHVFENKCIIQLDLGLSNVSQKHDCCFEKTIYYTDILSIVVEKYGDSIQSIQLDTAISGAADSSSNFVVDNYFVFDSNDISQEKIEEIADYIFNQIDKYKK